jgi:hypothetical protein
MKGGIQSCLLGNLIHASKYSVLNQLGIYRALIEQGINHESAQIGGMPVL